MLAIRFVVVFVVACAGPRFQHIGSPPPTAIEIERITLRWSNVYLLRKGPNVVLVDSGSPVDRAALSEAIVARGIAPTAIRAVVITHAHADHSGCARWLQTRGAAIVVGSEDVATVGRGTNEPLRPTGLLGALLASVFMFPFEPFTPDLAIDHEVDLAAYGFPEVHVVPVSGHTPGSIAVIVGAEAFTGDMIKGGELFTQSPTEHLYQTDPAANHRAIAALLARGVTRLYLGHGGPLAAADVTSWLADADDPGRDTFVSFELDVRGELPRPSGGAGATAGMRVRFGVGRSNTLGLGYAGGLDLRGGYLDDGGIYEADVHPAGLSWRTASGGILTVTGGIGIGGLRGTTATHALVEVASEIPLGPFRWFQRASLGWRLGGPAYASDEFSDELSALLGIRLGRDRRWGDYVAGKGPYLGLTYRDLGETEVFGIALGLEAFAGR